MPKQSDIYTQVTEQIIRQLEAGVSPWRKPWSAISGGMPSNVLSRRSYRGVNVLLLWSAAEANGWDSNLWGTFRNWQSLGGFVNKGEHGTKVIYWSVTTEVVTDKTTGEEREERRFFARQYTVFNLAQCGGDKLDRFRLMRPATDFLDFAPAEEAIAATGADIRFGGGRAFYRPADDFIQLPVKEAFESPAEYYSTALHELAHWTGHESRLSRLEKLTRFGSHSYAAEELVAELGAAFLTAALGVPNTGGLENNAAYLKSWLEVLRADSKAIFTASTAASDAADYVLEFSRGSEEGKEEEEAVAA